jgi:phosphoserine phosphatase
LSSKKIYLVRHGQTDYNLKGVVQGSGIDAPLNSTGLKQAHAFFQAYQNIPFTKVFYTGLQRTKQSIQQFLDLGIPYEEVKELNEICWGKYEGLPMTPQENKYYQEMLERWANGEINYAIEGGESPVMVAERLKVGIEKIFKQDGDHFLICMHGRSMRILLCLLLNYDLKCMDVFTHQNLGLYVLNRDEEGVFQVEKFNCGEHLKVRELI